MGLRPDEAIDAFRFAVSFVMGHVGSGGGVPGAETSTEEVDYGRPGRLGRSVTCIERLQAREETELFTSGLDLFIAGLEDPLVTCPERRDQPACRSRPRADGSH